jgi:hypothetical protein
LNSRTETHRTVNYPARRPPLRRRLRYLPLANARAKRQTAVVASHERRERTLKMAFQCALAGTKFVGSAWISVPWS